MKLSICSLSSGSEGNSIFIQSEHSKILIDAGLSGKTLTQLLNNISISPSELDAIIVTHEHTDHVKGVGVLSRRFDLPVIANELTWRAMSAQIGEVAERNTKIFKTWNGFSIKDIDFLPMGLSHDASDPVGFTVEKQNVKLSVLTDTGIISHKILKEIRGSNLFYIEANHDEQMLENGPYPIELKRRILSKIGHMSNVYCAKVLTEAMSNGNEQLVLGHLSETNNNPMTAEKSVTDALEQSGRKKDKDYSIAIASVRQNTKIFHL